VPAASVQEHARHVMLSDEHQVNLKNNGLSEDEMLAFQSLIGMKVKEAERENLSLDSITFFDDQDDISSMRVSYGHGGENANLQINLAHIRDHMRKKEGFKEYLTGAQHTLSHELKGHSHAEQNLGGYMDSVLESSTQQPFRAELERNSILRDAVEYSSKELIADAYRDDDKGKRELSEKVIGQFNEFDYFDDDVNGMTYLAETARRAAVAENNNWGSHAQKIQAQAERQTQNDPGQQRIYEGMKEYFRELEAHAKHMREQNGQ
jgi:hypothetical protein